MHCRYYVSYSCLPTFAHPDLSPESRTLSFALSTCAHPATQILAFESLCFFFFFLKVAGGGAGEWQLCVSEGEYL